MTEAEWPACRDPRAALAFLTERRRDACPGCGGTGLGQEPCAGGATPASGSAEAPAGPHGASGRWPAPLPGGPGAGGLHRRRGDLRVIAAAGGRPGAAPRPRSSSGWAPCLRGGLAAGLRGTLAVPALKKGRAPKAL